MCAIHTCYRFIQCRHLENGPIWNEVLAELRGFRGLLLVLSSSWWLPWNPCVLQSDASLQEWAWAHSFWSRDRVAEVARTRIEAGFVGLVLTLRVRTFFATIWASCFFFFFQKTLSILPLWSLDTNSTFSIILSRTWHQSIPPLDSL